MNFKVPKNTDKYEWTKHSLMKMQHYGLTAQRVLRVINAPQKKEEGVVEKTIAVMQPTSMSTKDGKLVWTSEIWAMYKLCRGKAPHLSATADLLSQNGRGGLGKKIKIISAWRYPGVSPKNNPIPEEILRDLAEVE